MIIFRRVRKLATSKTNWAIRTKKELKKLILDAKKESHPRKLIALFISKQETLLIWDVGRKKKQKIVTNKRVKED